jgi:glycosyltransferase involved in cell wall biosynthesis
MTVVTVITPSYNQGRYLEDTIRSVLGQEGAFFLDYLVIDGGSTDNSVEIIKKYDALLQRGEWPVRCGGIQYRWISEKDRGQTDAINKGVGMSKGEILAWLNSDDTYLAGALGKAADTLVREPDVSVLYGKTYFTDAQGEVVGKYPTEPFDHARLAVFNFICQPSTFLRKSAFTAVGGLDLSLDYVMDYDLWIRLSGKFTFRYLPDFLSTYRLHETSKTMSPAVALANHREALETVRKYYGWSPLNRVYMHCHHLVRSKLPAALADVRPLLVFLSLPCAVVRYAILNRGIRLADLRMISLSNIRKLFKKWSDIYREY